MSSEHWIKVRKGLNDSPKMIALSKLCGCTRERAFDAWFRLYSYFDSVTVDGDVDYFGPEDADRVAQLEGFGNALAAIGWLSFREVGCTIVDWQKHNGNSAKKRLLTNERVAAHRSRNA